jgi:flagellar basal-body rod protein FlgB
MDSIFGISGKALELSEQRSVLLSNNIANASTPHYKARDLDFQKVLKDEYEKPSIPGVQSNLQSSAAISYRMPMQNSVDGNTVDEDIERKDFLSNAINYQVNLTFIQNKSEQLLKAIKGE